MNKMRLLQDQIDTEKLSCSFACLLHLYRIDDSY